MHLVTHHLMHMIHLIFNASNFHDHSIHLIHLIIHQQLYCCWSSTTNDRLLSIKVQCIYAWQFINLYSCIWSVVWTCNITKVITESNHFLPFQQCCVMSYIIFLYVCLQHQLPHPYIKDVNFSTVSMQAACNHAAWYYPSWVEYLQVDYSISLSSIHIWYFGQHFHIGKCFPQCH